MLPTISDDETPSNGPTHVNEPIPREELDSDQPMAVAHLQWGGFCWGNWADHDERARRLRHFP